MNEHRSRAERAFDRHLTRGKYPDGSPVREGDRAGFIRAWNSTHEKLKAAKRRPAKVDTVEASAETQGVHDPAMSITNEQG